MTPYRFQRSARRMTSYIALLLVMASLGFLVLVFDASPWIIGIVAVVALPAAWDVAVGTVATFEVTDVALSWTSGKRTKTLNVTDIANIRFHTRLDGSRKMIVMLHSGEKVTVPPQCTPPFRVISDVLTHLGITYSVHHFQLW